MSSNPENKIRGLYEKYTVYRNDCSDMEGGKHQNCQYFVLDMTHDPHSKPALLAYADACERDGYHALARDLRRLLQ